MAKMVVVAVSDRAVGAFMRPFFAPSRGAAQRSFADEVNRDGSEMFKHPGDYELHFLGEWDEVTGTFDNLESHELIVRAKDCLRKPGG